MKDYQKEFLEFALQCGVLKFGDFTLKSGRKSPYFFNAGLFNTGEQLRNLGKYYAATIMDSEIDIDVLYGPAYKGIPLAAATVVQLANEYQKDLPYSFNRKEAKDHGEGGVIVGAELEGRVAIIDDVISAGTSVRESVHIINDHGAIPAAVFIALDRQERGADTPLSATKEVAQMFNLEVFSIASLSVLLDFLTQNETYRPFLNAVSAYRDEYGTE